MVTDKVELEISIGDVHAGKLVIGLFGNNAPLAVENFKHLSSEGVNGKTYEGSKFFRVIQRFMIQGNVCT